MYYISKSIKHMSVYYILILFNIYCESIIIDVLFLTDAICYMQVLTCPKSVCRHTRILSRFRSIWYTEVDVREPMCTFEVLDEHSGMCTVISSIAHLHI